MTASQPLDNDGVPDNDGGDYPSRGAGPKAIDEIVAALSTGTPFDRITPGISRAAAGADYLTGDVESAQWNPQALYEMLFANFEPDAEPVSPGLVAARKSVLDAVAADATSLRQKLGVGDRARLDEHLERIAAIEASLGQISAACSVPTDPGPRPPDGAGNAEPLEEVNEAMTSLVAYALACDLTRVFDFTYSRLQGYTHFHQIDVAEGHHQLGHDEGGDQPRTQQTIVYMMQHLAVLLTKLREIPVGDGNLLDHCCIWVTSEQNDPQAHGTFDTPTLVVGRAGGALRGGVHHDAGGDSDWHHRLDVPEALHAGVILTMMQALGMDRTSFGVGIGQSTHVMRPLLA
jgi:hypothetical protein